MTENTINNIRYFIDMDGTLAVYPSMDKENPWWEVRGIYKFLTPQDKVVKAIKRLIANGAEVFILSAYTKEYPQGKDDKDYWLDTYLPEIDKEHRIYMISGQNKADFIPDGVHITDVLLDDYNKNLENWAEAGGTGIKLLNGLNNKKSWSGISVKAHGSIKEIVQVLESVDHDLKKKEVQ